MTLNFTTLLAINRLYKAGKVLCTFPDVVVKSRLHLLLNDIFELQDIFALGNVDGEAVFFEVITKNYSNIQTDRYLSR